MNLFAGLEKFGIKADNTTDLFEDEKKPAASADGGKTEAAFLPALTSVINLYLRQK